MALSLEPAENLQDCEPHQYNVLMVGRPRVGKSTLIDMLKDPSHISKPRSSISIESEPNLQTVDLVDPTTGENYKINVIEIPDLNEVRYSSNTTRLDNQLVDQFRKLFINENIHELHAICFISKAGETHQNDVATFDSFLDFLDSLANDYKHISMIVLTHCEKLPDKTLSTFKTDIMTHSVTNRISNYCYNGIYLHGAIDYDDMNLWDNENEKDMYQKMLEKTRARVEKLHSDFVSALVRILKPDTPVSFKTFHTKNTKTPSSHVKEKDTTDKNDTARTSKYCLIM